MPMVNPAHKIPTNVSCKLSSWIARRVIAITNPRRPTFNMATVFDVLIWIYSIGNFVLIERK